MKTNDDVVKEWIHKARGDLRAMRITLREGTTEAACFHAQQAVEKLLKAYLISQDRDFPFTHDLVKLLAPAARMDPAFRRYEAAAKALNPYAVNIRYPVYPTPTLAGARSVAARAERFARFLFERLGPLGEAPRP